MVKCWWTLKVLCKAKDRPKRPNIVQFHLCEMPTKVKSIETVGSFVAARSRGRDRWDVTAGYEVHSGKQELGGSDIVTVSQLG